MNNTFNVPTSRNQATRPELDAYLERLPGYFPRGLVKGASVLTNLYLAHSDQIEFSLKRYVAGDRSLEQLEREIHDFMDLDELTARPMVAFSLKSVGDRLHRLEAYELLERYQTACTFINKQFSIQTPK